MDSEIKKYLAKTIREVVKEEVTQAITSVVLPVFVKMLQDSDGRIDRANGIMMSMSETMSSHIKCFDKNIAQLQKSKEACQENIKILITSNNELVRQLDTQLQQFNTQHDDYEARIHKLEYKNDTAETRYQAMVDKYGNLVDKITDMQPVQRRQQGNSSNSTVKIDMKH